MLPDPSIIAAGEPSITVVPKKAVGAGPNKGWCFNMYAQAMANKVVAGILLLLTVGVLLFGGLLTFKLITGRNAAGVSSVSPTLANKVNGAADMIHPTDNKSAASLSAAAAQPNTKAFLAPRASTASTGASQAAAPTASTASTAAKPESTHNKNSSN